MAGLLRSGRLLPVPSAPPSAVLRQYPQGVYTSCKIVRMQFLSDWELHARRISRGVQIYQATHQGEFKHLDSWLQQQGWTADDLVGNWIEPSIRQLLHQQRAGKEPAAQVDAYGMLLVVLHDASVAGDAPSWDPGIDILVQYSPATLTAKDKPVQVVVMGERRRIPHAKYSSWAAERAALEASKPAGFDEVILSEDGALLEGLVTNFYAVYGGVGGAPAVLRTAGTAQPALRGTAQARVIEAAHQLGVTVDESAPLIQQHEQWTEAFLTNALRGVQPVSRVFISNRDQTSGLDDIDCHLPEPYGPITRKLQEAAEQLVVLTDAETFAEYIHDTVSSHND